MKLFLLVVLLTGLVFAVPSSSLAAVTSAATAPDFTMSAHPNTLTIPQGSAGKSIILLTSVNGFQGNVTLSPPVSCLAIGCPQYTISPTVVQLAANQNATAGFTIYTSPQTPLATYNVAVTGTSGSLSHSVIVSFKITPSPDFTIALSPSSQTVRKGSTTTFTIQVTGTNGFNNTVYLTATIAPVTRHGPAISLPSSVGPYSTSTLTVSTTRSTQTGTYTITVTATSGSLTHTSTVTVTVTS